MILRTLQTVLAAATFAAPVFSASPMLIVRNELLPSPAQVGSSAPQLCVSAKGGVWMIWTEKAEVSARAVRVALFDPDGRSWRAPVSVSQGPDIAMDSFSTPQLAANANGKLVALWFISTPADGAQPLGSSVGLVSRSHDEGRTWSAPLRLTRESASQEFASLVPLSDGRFLALWLDGRNQRDSGGAQALAARLLYSETADQLLDRRVCDCCPTGLVSFPDGSARAVYRGRTEDEVREIQTLRFAAGSWTAPAPLSRGGWKLAGCPVNGPTIAANGVKTVAAWFSGEGDEPRVSASLSATAGEPFLMPARVDDGKPLGQVGAVALQDGSALVSWLDAGADKEACFILLRRISTDGTLSVPVRLATLPASRKIGVPRIALVHEHPGAATQILLACTEGTGELTHIATRLVTVEPPSPDRNPCATCPPEDTRGHPVHGYIQSIDTEKQLARMKHDEIPGVMPAMTMRFHVAAEDLNALKGAPEIYGRIERREDGWWLFSIRVVPQR